MSLFKASKKLVLFFTFFLLLLACDISKNRVDRSLYEVERNQKAIRKVTEFEIVEQGYHTGKSLADSAEAYFWQSISIAQNNQDSLFSCDEIIFPSQNRDFSISLVGASGTLKNEGVDIILKSYIENELKEPSLETLDNQQYLYSRPLWYDDQKCVTCHQQKRKENNNLAGIWSIQLSKKFLILEIPSVK